MMGKSIVLFGANGQIGAKLRYYLQDYDLIAYSRSEVDFLDLATVEKALQESSPGLIINCAAYTNVDSAEMDKENAASINNIAVAHIANKALELQAGFIHFSTDYVFDGNTDTDYKETDATNPINYYGYSKLAGEKSIMEVGGASIIIRTSWVYNLAHDNFVTKVLKWARTTETLQIVNDQYRKPTWSGMIAEKINNIVDANKYNWYDKLTELRGVYHLAGKNTVSRFDWAKKILDLDPRKEEQLFRNIKPVKSDMFPTKAIRPKYSGINCEKFEKVFNQSIPDWQDSLANAMSHANT